MRVTSLKLANLRAIKTAEFRFPPRFKPDRRHQWRREDERPRCAERLPLGGGEEGERTTRPEPSVLDRRHPIEFRDAALKNSQQKRSK